MLVLVDDNEDHRGHSQERLSSFLLTALRRYSLYQASPTSASSDCDGLLDSWYQEMLSNICHTLRVFGR